MLKKENSNIDFSKSSREVFNFVRGMAEWPVAVTNVCGNIIKVYSAEPVSYLAEREYGAGEVVCATSKLGLIVKCGEGFVRLNDIQPQNSKRMRDTDFLNGKKIVVGTKLIDVKFE